MWTNPLHNHHLIASNDSDSFLWLPEHHTALPLDEHPGSFGYQRKHHIHEGVDLYCDQHTAVLAVEDGTVVAIEPFTGSHANPPSPWWEDTWAVLVEGKTGVVVYGEIIPVVNIQIGLVLCAGTPIGFVEPVLKKDKGRPMTMLHLELHEQGTRQTFEWVDERPASLLDPTPYLLHLCSMA